MEYRTLGRSGFKVPVLSLGTVTFGGVGFFKAMGDLDAKGAARLVDICLDAGACCDYDSVIGMDKFEPVQRFLKKISGARFSPATGPATLCAVFVETDARGLAARIEPVRLGGRLKQTVPAL